jgi:hypothetical protein
MAYDRGQEMIRTQRQMIFADWYKYMLCCYRPADTQETTFPEPDWVKRLIEKDIVELYLTQTFVGQLQVLQNQTSKQFTATASAPPADKMHLSDIPSESIQVLGRDMLNRLEQQSPSGDPAEELQRRVFFLSSCSDWCGAFISGGTHIPEAMATLLGADIYGKAQPDFLSLYGDAAGEQLTFASIADMLAGDAVKPSDRHGEDGLLPCTVITQDVRTADSSVSICS